jgi:hypothetical protein
VAQDALQSAITLPLPALKMSPEPFAAWAADFQP